MYVYIYTYVSIYIHIYTYIYIYISYIYVTPDLAVDREFSNIYILFHFGKTKHGNILYFFWVSAVVFGFPWANFRFPFAFAPGMSFRFTELHLGSFGDPLGALGCLGSAFGCPVKPFGVHFGSPWVALMKIGYHFPIECASRLQPVIKTHSLGVHPHHPRRKCNKQSRSGPMF